MKRLLVVAALAASFLALPAHADVQQPGNFGLAPSPLGGPIGSPGVTTMPSAPATQNTITTTAPVSSETTISVGTLAGQFLSWIMVAFSGPIGGLAVWIMVRVLNNLGITASDAMRARLQEIVVNALNVSAPKVQAELAGKGQVEVKSAVVAQAVAYTQAHGADTIKALGIDPMSATAVDAIKARIETAIADPTTPTPAVLDPPAAVAPAA
jgi:hypothetical protein